MLSYNTLIYKYSNSIVPSSENKICCLLLLAFVGEEWFIEAPWSTVEHQRQIPTSCMENYRHRNIWTWSAMLFHSYCTAQSRKDFWFVFGSVVDLLHEVPSRWDGFPAPPKGSQTIEFLFSQWGISKTCALLWNYPLWCVHTGEKSACKWNYSSVNNPKNGKMLA